MAYVWSTWIRATRLSDSGGRATFPWLDGSKKRQRISVGFHEQAAADADAGGVSSLMRRIHTLARKAKGAVSWAQLRQQMNSREKKGISAALAEQAMQALAELGVGEVTQGPRGGLLYRATEEQGA